MADGPVLRGTGVVLTPLTADDAETTRLWRNRDDVRRWFKHSEPISAAAQHRWFAGHAATPDDHIWIVRDGRSMDRLGQVALYNRDRARGEAEIGRIVAAPEARGTSALFAACRAVIRHAFEDPGLNALTLEVFADNERAIRLYRRLGFRAAGAEGRMHMMRLERGWPGALPPSPHRTVWLASYPKSGNTWLRLFLANLLHPERAPVDINDIPLRTPIASGRTSFDKALGVPSALLLPEEVARLRPDADRLLALDWPQPLFRKAHDAYTMLPDGRPLMGQAPDFAAIYVVRDPCDVAVSASYHWRCPVEEAADRLLRDDALARSGQRLSDQLQHRLTCWASHVTGWIEAPVDLHVMRYEAMLERPLPSFRAAVRFLGLAHDDAAIEAAIAACRLDGLRKQEARAGFREARERQRFFRNGRAGEGRERLDPVRRAALERARDRVEDALAARGF